MMRITKSQYDKLPNHLKEHFNHGNWHCTVKPLKLMSYLITMGSRPNQVVLDPFAGSGTTLVAAKELGRRYIGIEMNKEYCDIARARLGI
jgi:site-specific DNA-methyltransferase (adenine-specific)